MAKSVKNLKDQKILIIVESPNKVSTISSILKKEGYTNALVQASVGHIMELKNGGSCFNSGIFPDKDFQMNLAVSEDKTKVVNNLKAMVPKVDKVYLMTDGDREGEVIAWSLIKFLKIPENKYCRVITHEITPKAVVKALENPVGLNMNLVNAGLTRLMIDKLIGFGLSPLGKKQIGAKSIGRCQSVGLNLIVGRENEILSFVPVQYFDLYLAFNKANTGFKARYIGTETDPVEHLNSQAEVDKVISDCDGNKYVIKNVKKVNRQESPKPPFCTATFQQEAALKLGLKVKDAMSCAQKLFEGISVSGEHVGLITYMRTDSTDLAPEFLPDLKNYIDTTYGAGQYTTPRTSKKMENDQDGHEALRVSDISMTPDKLATYVTNNLLLKVYKLIWQRTVASAMPNAVIAETSYTISNGEHRFILVSRELSSPGYRTVYSYSDSIEDEEMMTVTFNENEELQNTSLESIKKATKPKARYTEASLIKELQKREIGRPSTYATIVETILSPTRGYSSLDEKCIVPTDRGMQLSAFTDRAFPDIINLEFTKEMEKSLDEISEGRLDWLDYMKQFYANLIKAIGTNVETAPLQATEKVCPNCGSPMVVRRSRFGKLFYGCSKYPKCNGILNMD